MSHRDRLTILGNSHQQNFSPKPNPGEHERLRRIPMRRPLQHSAAVKCAVSLSAPAAQLAALSHHMVEGAQQAIWSGSDAFRLHLTSGVKPL